MASLSDLMQAPTAGTAPAGDWFSQQGAPSTPGSAESWLPGGGAAEPGGLTGGGAAGASGPTAGQTATPANPFTAGMSPDQVRAAANALISQAGVANVDNGQYWVNAYQQFGQNDPNYFFTRLMNGILTQPGYNNAYGQGNGQSYGAGTPGAGGGAGDGGGAAGGIGAGLENTPGFQFRLGQGLQALQRSAAARGTLLTGGTLKGIENYAQNLASTEYGNRVNQLMDLSKLGYGAAGAQANLGSSYAGQAGGLLQNQAGMLGNAYTGIGNAQSAGTIGAANAYGQGIGGATNALQQYYLMSLLTGGNKSGGSTLPGDFRAPMAYVPPGAALP